MSLFMLRMKEKIGNAKFLDSELKHGTLKDTKALHIAT